jgi:hypothetical protein
MQKTDTHAFVNQLLVYTLVMICFSGGVGLGTVWLRYQISVTARRNKDLETRIAEVERHLAETTTAIETEEGPGMLMNRNAEMHLGLVQASEAQVVARVNQDVAARLAAKLNQGLYTDVGVTPIVSLGRMSEPAAGVTGVPASFRLTPQASRGRLAAAEVKPVVFRLGRSR